jgi:hypothetical protein
VAKLEPIDPQKTVEKRLALVDFYLEFGLSHGG